MFKVEDMRSLALWASLMNLSPLRVSSLHGPRLQKALVIQF